MFNNLCVKALSVTGFLLLLFLTSSGIAARFDPASTQCLKCHESMVDPADASRLCHSDGCTHPIGLDYVSASRRNPGLMPPAKLGSAIKLVGADSNLVGCTTCHVPYTSEAKHKELSDRRATEVADPMLSTTNRRSSLCLGCHQK